MGDTSEQTETDTGDFDVSEESSNESFKDEDLIAELEENNVKFTKDKLAFITKDRTGQTIWLETGKTSAGLDHLLNGDGIEKEWHAKDFKNKFGINREQVPSFLKMVISNGEIVRSKMVKRGESFGYERIYRYGDKCTVLIGIGTNGFVVTAYPND